MAPPLLFTYGFVALLLTINALRRLRRPGALLPPLWLPAMITGALAPFWLLTRVAIGAALTLTGGTRLAMGRLGLWMLILSAVGLLLIITRDLQSTRMLRPLIQTSVFPETLPTWLTGRPIPTPDGLEQIDRIPYDESNTLDLIRAPNGPESQPLFVYVHGGGWTGGGPQKQARRMYHTLARAGWAVAALRYPLAPEATICDQVLAIKQAIGYLVDRSNDYGVDPHRIVLSGGSAGGHLAALATLTSSKTLGGAGPDPDVLACVPMYGIYDMANRNRTRPDWPYVDRDVMRGSYVDKPDEFHIVSPLDQVHADAPPFLVIHGTHDSLVPIAEAEMFVKALDEAGADVEFVRVLGAQHGFDALSTNVSRHVAALVTTWANALIETTARPRDH